jgi:hypothetical protein
LGWVEYTKKGVVCQEGKTTREKTRRYEEKVQADIADNDYKSNLASYSKSVSQRGRKSASHLAMSV